MARGALDNIETEGDFAFGMGIAIGMFIALFAVGIALFVIEQGKAHPAPQRDAAAIIPAAERPAGSTQDRSPQ
jgi:hypothetical protein